MSRTQAASSHRRGPSVPEVRAKTAVDLLIYLLLLVAVCLVYGQVRHYPLVDFDDLVYVTHNRHVASGVTLEGVVWAFTRSYEGY